MTHVDIAIIGGGFSGLGAAIRLRQRGFTDFAVFDEGAEVGGTWRDNTYPGCACDVPSHLYSFSFALNPDWSNTFSGQDEIWRYLLACVDRFGVRPHILAEHGVTDASWSDDRQLWVLTTSHGVYTARVMIGATGPLSAPSTPDIAGLERFEGKVFHSARWEHDYDLGGKRVAVIGTGASAIQFVPEIQPKVAQLKLFQRTPAWVMPRRSRPISRVERGVYRRVPGAQRLVRTALYWVRESMAFGFLHPGINKLGQRIALRNLHKAVKDRALREKLTPRYVMGCKRVLTSNDYYPALVRPNVEVITTGIREITPSGVVTADGVEHQIDTIILGTGFHVTDMPVLEYIKGRGGVSLRDAWSPTMRAYLGTTVVGFPNLFFILGPNTGLGHTSVVLMAEGVIEQIIKTLEHMRDKGIHAVEPTPAAQTRFVSKVDAKMRGTVWSTGGCQSWYLDSTGRNSTLWPGFVTSFRLRMRKFYPSDYSTVEVSRDLVAQR